MVKCIQRFMGGLRALHLKSNNNEQSSVDSCVSQRRLAEKEIEIYKKKSLWTFVIQ